MFRTAYLILFFRDFVSGSSPAPFLFVLLSCFFSSILIAAEPITVDITAAYAEVRVENLWGFIDKAGHYIIAPSLLKGPSQNAHAPMADPYWAMPSRHGWGFVDTHKHWIIKPQFTEAMDFHEELAAVKLHDDWGYINTRSILAINYQFEEVGNFSEGRAMVKSQGNVGLIDKKGKFILQPDEAITSISEFHEGLAGIVYNDHGEGYIDRSGQLVIPPIYEEVEDFNNGSAAVKKDGKWGIIDKKGRWLITPQYDQMWFLQQ